jgi:septum formation topological specificity factor MinE
MNSDLASHVSSAHFIAKQHIYLAAHRAAASTSERPDLEVIGRELLEVLQKLIRLVRDDTVVSNDK